MPGRTAQAVQGVVTVLTPIRPGHLAALEGVLACVRASLLPEAPPGAQEPMPFEAFTTVHFLRWLILPEGLDAGGATIGAELVMASCFDGDLDDHLRELVRVARVGLDEIYAHCEGYPRTPEEIVTYLRAHVAPSAAYYVGNPQRAVTRIRMESRLRNLLEEVIDEQIAGPEKPRADAVAQALRAHVARTPELRWALEPPPRPPLGWYVRRYARLAVIVAAAIPLLPILLPVLLALRLVLHHAEAGEGVQVREPIDTDTEAALAHLDALTALEDFEVQNQMTLVSPIKPGRLRLVALRVVCWVIQLRATYLDTKGSLGGIPSIHFAHWNIIDNGRRLLFCSNYDGTWESYLGEFIDRAASALTAIWSNCIDFPRTRFLVIGGARDEQRFKEWIRGCQIATQVWYAAYPRLSVQNIQNSSEIRVGFDTQMGEAACAAWLRRF